MTDKSTQVGLFSGRYDPPHLGHLVTVFDLARQYRTIYVVVLDYEGREACTAKNAKAIFDFILDVIYPPASRNKIKVLINKHHFGFITKNNLPHCHLSMCGLETMKT